MSRSSGVPPISTDFPFEFPAESGGPSRKLVDLADRVDDCAATLPESMNRYASAHSTKKHTYSRTPAGQTYLPPL
jgi:hypothetical protein